MEIHSSTKCFLWVTHSVLILQGTQYKLSMSGNMVTKKRLNQNHFFPASYLVFDTYRTKVLAIFLSSLR